MSLQDVGEYEIYTIPTDGSQIIIMKTPVNEDCIVTFKYDVIHQKWQKMGSHWLKSD